MIEIKCIEMTAALDECNTKNMPLCTVYAMTDRSERLGVAFARGEGEETEVLLLEAPDIPLTDALFRAVLNAERANGAKTAKICCPFLQQHVQKKKYAMDMLTKRIDIADFFAKTVCKD